MPVLESEIHFYGSGTSNLGGAIDTVSGQIPDNTLHALFDPVTAAQAQAGVDEYRCIYVKNTNATDTLNVPVIFIASGVSATGTSVQIGVTAAGAPGDTEQDLGSNEELAPGDVSFVNAPDAVSGVSLGDLAPNAHRGVWIKRIITPASGSFPSDQFTLTVSGETA